MIDITQETKKQLAREFLYFSTGAVLTFCIYIGSAIYKSNLESEYERKEEKYQEVNERIKKIRNSPGSEEYAKAQKEKLFKKMSKKGFLDGKYFFENLEEFAATFNSENEQKKLFNYLTYRDDGAQQYINLGTKLDLYHRLNESGVISNLPDYSTFINDLKGQKTQKLLYDDLKGFKFASSIPDFKWFNKYYFDKGQSNSISNYHQEIPAKYLKNNDSEPQLVYLGSFDKFIEAYFPPVDSSIIEQENELSNEKTQLYKFTYSNPDVLPLNLTLRIGLIYFVLFFPLRYFTIGIVWSIRTIRS